MDEASEANGGETTSESVDETTGGTGDAASAAHDEFDELLEQVARATNRTPGADEAERPEEPVRGSVLEETYEIIGELSDAGGMGKVFVARDLRLGRRVVVKMVRMRKFDEEHRLLFEREARATAQLNHRNIVTIHAFGFWNDAPYMVLEHLKGESLHERVRDSRPSEREVVEILTDVVRGLLHAHERGVYHRDIKPENIFLTDAGEVKLLDFGISMFDLDEEALTSALESGSDELLDATPEMSGTPGFMAPEQWRGRDQDARTDIWAVGATMYVLLAGEYPYNPRKPATLMVDGVAPIREVAEEIHPATAKVVDRALKPEADERFESASELYDALQEARDELRRTDEVTGSPFRYLEPFSEEEARWFFGRDAEIARLVHRVEANPLTAVVGPSGAGKTSLVRAGLIPELRERKEAEVVSVRPGDRPLDQLHRRLADFVEGDDRRLFEHPEYEPLLERPGLAGQLLRARARQREGMVLLVVQQFEELFVARGGGERRDAFVAALCSASDDPRSDVRVVCTMREDFLSELVDYPSLHDRATQNPMALGAPDADALAEMLTGPLELAGYDFPDELPDRVVEAIADDSTPLPTLQIVASRLWERRDQANRRIPEGALEDVGGVGGAVSAHADDVVGGLQGDDRLEMARDMLCALVAPGGTARTMSWNELVDRFWAADRAAEVLDHLVSGRLVTAASEEGETTVELAHEALIERWDRLARWRREESGTRRFRERLAQAAHHWNEEGRPEGLLWGDAMLGRASDWAESGNVQLTVTEREFLDASREKHRGRELQHRVLYGGFVFVGLIAAGLFWFGGAQGEVDAEQTNRMAALAQELSATKPGIAVTMAGRALRERQNSETVTALHEALASDHTVARHSVESGVQDAAWTLDGRSIVALPNSGWSISRWNVETGEESPVWMGGEMQYASAIEETSTLYFDASAAGGELRCDDGARIRRGTFEVVQIAEGTCRRPVVSKDHRPGVAGMGDGSETEWFETEKWEGVETAHLSPDGAFLSVTGWRSEDAKWFHEVIEVSSRELVRRAELDESVVGLDWGASDARMWVLRRGSDERGGRLELQTREGEVRDGVDLRKLSPEEMRVGPQGRRVAVIGGEDAVWLFESGDGDVRSIGRASDVTEVQFDPRGGRIALVGDRQVRLREFGSASAGGRTVRLQHDASVDGVRFAVLLDRVVTWTGARGFLWNAGGHRLESFRVEGDIRGLASARAGRYVLSVTETGVEVDNLWGRPEGVLVRHAEPVADFDFDRNGRRLVSASGDGDVRVSEIGVTEKEWFRASRGRPSVGYRAISSNWFVASGRNVAVRDGEGEVKRSWRVGAPVAEAGWVPDESAVWVLTREDRIEIQGTSGARTRFEVAAPASPPIWSDDGSKVLVAGPEGGSLRSRDGSELESWEWNGSVADTAFYDGGPRVATLSSEGEISLHGEDVPARLVLDDSVAAADVALEESGPHIAVLTTDGAVEFYRLGGGGARRFGEVPGADTVALGPKGRHLVVSDGNYTWIWNTRSGARVGRLPAGAGSLDSDDFSPDGELLALPDGDGALRVFALDPEQLLAIAREQAHRPLTAAVGERFGLETTGESLRRLQP